MKSLELYLCYQPILTLTDSKLYAVEPLLRWDSAEFGKVPIEGVVTVAEDSGLVVELGDRILEEAFSMY